MQKRYYAAYGSNLNVAQMICRCPGATIVGTAELKDHRILYKGSLSGNYLTVEKCKGRSVPLGIWAVDEYDERSLDRYEGFPAFYKKIEVVVPITNLRTGKTTNRRVFIYIMRKDAKAGLPSERYVETCERGYSDFGFDHAVLGKAYEETLEAIFDE